jgi:hypothetical protein
MIKNIKSIVPSDRMISGVNETHIITQISKVKKVLPEFNTSPFQNYKLLEVLTNGKRIY